ncbi:hypothetical protein, partial [Pseudomonas viridiflava]|uniref:hypothetical protein n=1 Tax=Pseudomonas viridiflava TaxID=33069 RepID=UPI0019D1446F
EQHMEARGSYYPAYRNKEGLDAPYHNVIAHRLPQKAKFYLVPSLSPMTTRRPGTCRGSSPLR